MSCAPSRRAHGKLNKPLIITLAARPDGMNESQKFPDNLAAASAVISAISSGRRHLHDIHADEVQASPQTLELLD